MDTSHTRTRKTTVQFAALVVGVVLLLVGVLGFIPGVTQNYDSLQAAGHHSEAIPLGVFQVFILQSARMKVAGCDRKLAQHRAAHEVGADPVLVTKRIAETQT